MSNAVALRRWSSRGAAMMLERDLDEPLDAAPARRARRSPAQSRRDLPTKSSGRRRRRSVGRSTRCGARPAAATVWCAPRPGAHAPGLRRSARRRWPPAGSRAALAPMSPSRPRDRAARRAVRAAAARGRTAWYARRPASRRRRAPAAARVGPRAALAVRMYSATAVRGRPGLRPAGDRAAPARRPARRCEQCALTCRPTATESRRADPTGHPVLVPDGRQRRGRKSHCPRGRAIPARRRPMRRRCG